MKILWQKTFCGLNISQNGKDGDFERDLRMVTFKRSRRLPGCGLNEMKLKFVAPQPGRASPIQVIS
ncbi:MAG: hypothetical protein P4L55_12570, partial [Syntrophobacteraceae bacterium]|nr:hypothetical protein [Syntrophobacteraceae bacterium]